MTEEELRKLLVKIVETEELDKRMSLVEENIKEMATGNEDSIKEDLKNKETEVNDLKTKLEEQKKKYRDTFKTGGSNNDGDGEGKKEEKKLTLDDILNFKEKE